MMDPVTIKHYLADSPPSVVPLAIKPHFEALNDQEKLYAHYISMYAFPMTYHILFLTSRKAPASRAHA